MIHRLFTYNYIENQRYYIYRVVFQEHLQCHIEDSFTFHHLNFSIR